MLMDIYVLSPERSAAAVERFLDRFLPQRRRADADYAVYLVNGSSPVMLDTPEEMAAFCETRLEADARAYWNNSADGDPHSAHVFFLSDGGLVLGLSVATRDEATWDRWLGEMKSFNKAVHGYMVMERPPLDPSAVFIAAAKAVAGEKGTKIQAGLRYGGLALDCDEEAFARLRDHLLSEPSVAAAISGMEESCKARFVSIRPPKPAKPWRAVDWMLLIAALAASAVSAVAYIVGWIMMINWLIGR